MNLPQEIRDTMSLYGRPFAIPWSVQKTLDPAAPEQLWDNDRQLVERLGAVRGPARDQQVLELFSQGLVPGWMKVWWPVSFEAKDAAGKVRRCTIYCLPDYLAVGTNQLWCYTPMSPLTAEAIGMQMGGRLVTRELARRIYAAAPQKVAAEPWGEPYDGSMMLTSRWPVQTRKVLAQMTAKRFQAGILTAGHLKDVVVGQGMQKSSGGPANNVGIWGWMRADGSVIQGPSTNWHSHEVTYCDYAHGSRIVKEEMEIDEQQRPISEVLRDPVEACLICDELSATGVLDPGRYASLYGGAAAA